MSSGRFPLEDLNLKFANNNTNGNEGLPGMKDNLPGQPLASAVKRVPLSDSKSSELQTTQKTIGGASNMLGLWTPRTAQQIIEEQGTKVLQMDDKELKGVDPYENTRKPSFRFPRKLWLTIIMMPVACWILLLMCLGLDKMTRRLDGQSYTPMDLVLATFAPDDQQGRCVIESVLNTMAVIFGLLITVIGIILQLSANRFTSQVTKLFFKDPTIGLALSYVVFGNAFGFWVYLSIGPNHVPRASILLCMLMVISHLLLIFPFLAYLFYFLEPDKVVTKIMMAGLKAASDSINHHGRNIDKQQVRATLAVEHLMDAANSAVKRKDKNITSEIVDALCSFTIHYGLQKVQMFSGWFTIPMWIRQSPDFLTLSDEAITALEEKKTWMEWKILRQYQLLFNESMKLMKELCYHIAMNTRIIGEAAGRRSDYHTLDLCIKFFNTYIRAGISSNDVRTVYNVLFQYRNLAEFIIRYGTEITENSGEEDELEVRAVRICKYMRYYAFLCLNNLPFLVEVIAQDIRVLCETAFHWNSAVHGKLLEIFLTVDDGSHGVPEKANQGVLRAQIILATTYLCWNRTDLARKIQEDFVEDSHKRLWGLMKELQNISNKEFWEVSERGTNFTYLGPDQKAQLPLFFSWFKNFSEEVPLDPLEKKKFERQQELMNFL